MIVVCLQLWTARLNNELSHYPELLPFGGWRGAGVQVGSQIPYREDSASLLPKEYVCAITGGAKLGKKAGGLESQCVKFFC